MIKPDPHPFNLLSPDEILDAVEAHGFISDGRVTALNSFENRVYQIGIENQPPVIAKFYRPNRWTVEQIQEEHDFLCQLNDHDITVVTPMLNEAGHSVFSHHGFSFALFPRKGGHAPELDHQDNLAIMGRTLARLHQVGEQQEFKYRPALNAQTYGLDSLAFVSQQFIPAEHQSAYLRVTEDIMALITPLMAEVKNIRVHGDLHIGNILLRDEVPFLVDFDDARSAPAIQDIWMLLSGEPAEQHLQLQKIRSAYNEFRPFPQPELKLIEPLRTLRLIHHTAWLARRWDDPAFPPAFPWFDTHVFWQQHVADLQNQLQALQSPHQYM